MGVEKISVKDIKAAVTKLDDGLEPNTPAFRCAVVMLSATVCGAHDLSLRRFTEYPKYEVQDFYARFVRAGIFRDGEVHHSGWFDDDPPGIGGMAFWCDVLCGMGQAERRKSPEGEGFIYASR